MISIKNSMINNIMKNLITKYKFNINKLLKILNPENDLSEILDFQAYANLIDLLYRSVKQ